MNIISKKKKQNNTEAGEEKRELHKMKKNELIEILLEQGDEIDELRERVSELERELDNDDFEVRRVGTLSEASAKITEIFSKAEEAAKDYLINIRRSHG